MAEPEVVRIVCPVLHPPRLELCFRVIAQKQLANREYIYDEKIYAIRSELSHYCEAKKREDRREETLREKGSARKRS